MRETAAKLWPSGEKKYKQVFEATDKLEASVMARVKREYWLDFCGECNEELWKGGTRLGVMVRAALP